MLAIEGVHGKLISFTLDYRLSWYRCKTYIGQICFLVHSVLLFKVTSKYLYFNIYRDSRLPCAPGNPSLLYNIY